MSRRRNNQNGHGNGQDPIDRAAEAYLRKKDGEDLFDEEYEEWKDQWLYGGGDDSTDTRDRGGYTQSSFATGPQYSYTGWGSKGTYDGANSIEAADRMSGKRDGVEKRSWTVKTICLDFDGVLNIYDGFATQVNLGPPRPGVEKFLAALKGRGFDLVVLTCNSLSGVWNWLHRHDLAVYITEVTHVKPPAFVYIDDRAMCFRGDFNDTLQQVDNFRTHWKRGEFSTKTTSTVTQKRTVTVEEVITASTSTERTGMTDEEIEDQQLLSYNLPDGRTRLWDSKQRTWVTIGNAADPDDTGSADRIAD